MIPGLYIVSTPIGNLKDITVRAVETLQKSNIILCEDTRVTQKLLQYHSIQCDQIFTYNDHTNIKYDDKIINYINSGSIVSLVSDAGTPCISDPGSRLINHCYKHKCYVDVVPGACSPISALLLSGFAGNTFYFIGFLPKTDSQKCKLFEKLKTVNSALIFFETKHRLTKSLEIALDVLGDQKAAVVREMTKIYQEVQKNTLSNLLDYYKSLVANSKTVKGEIVLIIENNYEEKQLDTLGITKEAMKMYKKGLSKRDITNIISEKFCLKKQEVYKVINQAILE